MNGWKTWRGPEAKVKMQGASRMAVMDTGAAILDASQAEVPLRDGFLQRSGVVVMAPGDVAEGCVSYGGGEGTNTGNPIVPYARRWHENSANFQKGRKRFYLKDPFNRLGASELKRNLEKYGRSAL
jgi:hypothetical protein